VRSFWKGDAGQVPEMATRMTGSSDIFDSHGRRPWASVNFVAAHDGFTLQDVVSYNEKHNEANGENNQDGSNNNNSWNCGVEGKTDDPAILRLRAKQRRNMLATLLLSQGLPMIVAGDEFGRSQGGNNNAYCQDDEISWIDWQDVENDAAFLQFTRNLIRLRREHIVFHRSRFYHARFIPGTNIQDITWLMPDAREMTGDDWSNPKSHFFGALVRGEAGEYHLTAWGEPQPDRSFLFILNAHHGPVVWTLPPLEVGLGWELVFDTDKQDGFAVNAELADRSTYEVPPRSFVLFVRKDEQDEPEEDRLP
jgi:glycogen operon protein